MPDIALFPEQASTAAREVDLLLFFLVGVCGSMGLLVAVLLIYFSVRYRRRPGQIAPPPETRESQALEWFWTVAPVGVFAVMFFWGADVYTKIYHAPSEAITVYGIGKQWMWKFQHAEGHREINTLHVPIGRPVKLVLTSEDVIHSFFVPAFRVHMDVLPERYTSVSFEPSRRGTYHLFCSQYCGTGHAGMLGSVVALEPAEYQRWLESGADGSLALRGRQIFLKYRCLSCHSANENARAPVLEALYGKRVYLRDAAVATADEQYLRESILHAGVKIVAGYENIMPTFAGQISEEEVIALIGYLKSLAAGETPTRVEDFPPPLRIEPSNADDKRLPGAEDQP